MGKLPADEQTRDAQLPTVLLVDDDPLITESLGFILARHYQVLSAESRPQARKLLSSLPSPPELALIDLGLPPNSHSPEEGFALIEELLAHDSHMKILVLSGQSDEANMHHALTLGAVDFIPKPADPGLLQTRLQHHLMLQQLESRQQPQADRSPLIGDSPAIRALREQVSQFSDSIFPVLIEGESGTGKELAAGALHQFSSRASRPYLVINCAAIAPELLESQLFGHCKGAFTGADTARAGFFEEADEGTLFLDEIGEMPFELQAKLLRVLESGEYYRVGETRPRTSRARIIAATNKSLQREVNEGRFRSDLYHRLSILKITMPPLREREQDSLLLLQYFMDFYAESLQPVQLDEAATRRWLGYDFPGNVRELRNIVIRLCTKFPAQTISAQQLEQEFEQQLDTQGLTNTADELFSTQVIQQQLTHGELNLDEKLRQLEDMIIQQAMQLYQGNISKVAKALKINRTTLYSRMQKYEQK